MTAPVEVREAIEEILERPALRARLSRYTGDPDENGCRLWEGTLGNGHPLFRFESRRLGRRVGFTGRRAVWTMHHGEAPPPTDLEAITTTCHRALCVAPEHLLLAPIEEIHELRTAAGVRPGLGRRE